MAPLVKILIPTISRPAEEYCFRGYVSYLPNEIIIYFTKFLTAINVLQNKNCEDDFVYGYFENKCNYSAKKTVRKHNNLVIMNQTTGTGLIIKILILNGKPLYVKDCIFIYYDYENIANSEVKWEFDDVFYIQSLIQKENQTNLEVPTTSVLTCPPWLASSMFIQHIINYINMISWTVASIRVNKKISIKHGNFIVSILTDIFVGYLVRNFLTRDTKEVSGILMGLLEKLINVLNLLLNWLMGAPAGLKLNNAFNKMLGIYFFYHVKLWFLFLEFSGEKLDVSNLSGEKLDVISHLYYYIGYLGFTFQAALISDMICVATFHSYCIYVYAARMFNIQMSGLIALMRFFVGRKYNPLRGSIDSCEYTNQELFVGTVAFTILLLLQPTTAMYYIVFTLFRMLSLLVQYALAKVIYLLHTLPLYVVGLWLLRSPKVAGNVLLEVIDSKEESHLSIRLKVFNKSIFYLINHFRPPVVEPYQLQWSSVLSNVFIGKQIV